MRFTSTNHHPLPKTSCTRPWKRSPLDIVELLLLVFSFLDDYTINCSVVAVCRRWNHLCQDRLYRELWWDTRWPDTNPAYAISRVPGTKRIRLACSSLSSGWNQIERILTAAIKHQEQLKQPPGRSQLWAGRKSLPTMYPFRMTTELEICCHYQTPTLATLDRLFFRYPPSLTSLKIDIQQSIVVPLEVIIADCPLLESLDIRGEPAYLDGAWAPVNNESSHPLPLRTLILTNTLLNQAHLEDFLRLTPRLSTLKLIGLATSFFDVKGIYSWEHLVPCLKDLPLISCHFSVQGLTQIPSQVRDRAVVMTPNSTEWCLYPREISPLLLQELIAMPNVVTSLELFGPNHDRRNHGFCAFHDNMISAGLLHDFLCQSPHLAHLKAIRSPVFIDHLDICDRAQYRDLGDHALRRLTKQRRKLPVRRPVWMCRGLRTLHMEVHGMNVRDSPVNSRIVFGYISAVCPVLEELVLVAKCTENRNADVAGFSHVPLSLELDGGICFLTKIASLNKLSVIGQPREKAHQMCECGLSRTVQQLGKGLKPSEFELNWIAPSGRTPGNAALRETTVATWDSWLSVEEKLEAPWSVSVESLSDEQAAALKERDRLDPLQQIGLLSSVKRVVAEMDREGNRIFPVLQKLSLGLELGMPPEKALQSYFCNAK
ncbi:hypothetical protein EC957_005898 [Mortierella hygrophila]|uniref:F-box domain-containing protein n=1 Tax=Mortierella hygrophila TaxID=979708 RepID=A0A9P6FEW7_9FUNG|nr:hypothetical protein EC957_005898 [Mortierella hygrophila]